FRRQADKTFESDPRKMNLGSRSVAASTFGWRLGFDVVECVWAELHDSGRRRLRRVSDYRAVPSGTSRQRVYLEASRADDFLDADAEDHQRVGDQRAMATPRHGLGAHKNDSLARRLFDEARQ